MNGDQHGPSAAGPTDQSGQRLAEIQLHCWRISTINLPHDYLIWNHKVSQIKFPVNVPRTCMNVSLCQCKKQQIDQLDIWNQDHTWQICQNIRVGGFGGNWTHDGVRSTGVFVTFHLFLLSLFFRLTLSPKGWANHHYFYVKWRFIRTVGPKWLSEVAF